MDGWLCKNCTLETTNPTQYNWLNTNNWISQHEILDRSTARYTLNGSTKIIEENYEDLLTDFTGFFAEVNRRDIYKLISIYTENGKIFDQMFKDCNYFMELPTDYTSFRLDNGQSFKAMFENCSSLVTVPDSFKISGSYVNNIEYLFYGCSKLANMLGSINTTNCQSFDYMFAKCSALPSLTINLNTINGKSFKYMFSECTKLTSITDFDISNIGSQLSNLSHMFYNCTSLKAVPNTIMTYISSVFTKVLSNSECPYWFSSIKNSCVLQKDQYDWFKQHNWLPPEVYTLKYTDLSNKVCSEEYSSFKTNFNSKFIDGNIRKLISINTSKMNSFIKMFYNCTELSEINLDNDSNFTISGVTIADQVNSMFYNCNKLISLPTNFFNELKNKFPTKLLSCANWFTDDCELIYQSKNQYVWLDNNNWIYHVPSCIVQYINKNNEVETETYKSTKVSFDFYFYDLTKKKPRLDLKKLIDMNTSAGISFIGMFYNCSALESINDLNIYNITKGNSDKLSAMFYNCSSLTTLPKYFWKYLSTTFPDPLEKNAAWFSFDCELYRKNITQYNWLSTHNWLNLTEGTTYNCIFTSGITNVTKPYNKRMDDFSDFFIKTIKIGGKADLTKLISMETKCGIYFDSMFDNCKNLISVAKIDTSNGTSFEKMFYNCTKLTSFDLTTTKSGINFNYMFANCTSDNTKLFTNIKKCLSSTYNGQTFTNMFENTYIKNVPYLHLNNATNVSAMFNNCTTLQSIDNIDINPNLLDNTKFTKMFYNCKALKTVPSSLMAHIKQIGKLETTNNCFTDCTSISGTSGTGLSDWKWICDNRWAENRFPVDDDTLTIILDSTNPNFKYYNYTNNLYFSSVSYNIYYKKTKSLASYAMSYMNNPKIIKDTTYIDTEGFYLKSKLVKLKLNRLNLINYLNQHMVSKDEWIQVKVIFHLQYTNNGYWYYYNNRTYNYTTRKWEYQLPYILSLQTDKETTEIKNVYSSWVCYYYWHNTYLYFLYNPYTNEVRDIQYNY